MTLYNTIVKLKSEQLSKNDRRSFTKLVDELQQNIVSFQTDNKYYLELYRKNHNNDTNITLMPVSENA